MQNRIVFGSLEKVSIPALNVSDVIAKVDTGAFSGAIHCTNIYLDETGLHFTPLGEPELATCVHEFEEVMVRSANGHSSVRYLIPITLVIKGKEYKTIVGLSDRALMRREMLLGRRFLLENDVLVDVKLSKSSDDEAERFDV